MDKAKKVFCYSIIILINFCCLEGISYYLGKYLENKGVLYKAQETFDDFENYLTNRHPVLGWVPKGDVDETGSRIIPAFPDPLRFPACVSLYGDSFTWAAEVDNEQAWSNVLSLLLGCRVANYGGGGYGTDQAFLRFKLNTQDKSKVVIMGFLTENIFRNVNQFRNLLYPNHRYALKPRFILNSDGDLKLIPVPNISKNEYMLLVKEPERYLKHEYFFLEDFGHLNCLEFPYILSVLKCATHFYILAKIAGKPSYSDFYQMNHKSGSLQVTNKILIKFYKDAIHEGRIPIVVILPTYDDLQYYKKHQKWIFQNIINLLNKDGVEPLNVGEDMLQMIGERNLNEFFTDTTNHLNAEGNKILANIVYKKIKGKVNCIPAKNAGLRRAVSALSWTN
jgi:hypothetical protein